MDAPGCDRRAEVAEGYRRTAAILLELARRFDAPGDEARAAWQLLADTVQPEVILPPSLVIGNYDALNGTEPGMDGTYARSGEGNARYLVTIRRHGASVVEIGRGDTRVLPLLALGEVRAQAWR